jgi:heat shock protein HslJ
MKWLCAITLLLACCAVSPALAQSAGSPSQTPEACQPTQASNLAMGQWRFVSIAGTAVKAVGSKQPYLKFESSKNAVTGYTGCNRLHGRYTADESSLAFQQLITTRMACMDDSYERQVLDVLNSATGYKIVGHELHLVGPSGTLAILTRPHQEQTTQKKPAE